MPPLQAVLVIGSLAAVASWMAVSTYVLVVQRNRQRAHRTIAAVRATLKEVTGNRPLDNRLAHVRPLLERASRELVMRAVIDASTSDQDAAVLSAYLIECWGLDRLLSDAASHRTARDKWRRMAALQILGHLRHPDAVDLAARAVEQNDGDVALVALSLLGGSDDPAAPDVLITALKERRQPGSRVAAQLDRSPQHLAARLRPLLEEPEPVVRLWGATLLGRYDDVPGLEHDLVEAAADPDARVRKAAVQSLGSIGSEPAGATARRLLADPIPFVRATAARAIARLDRLDMAEEVAVLLGDPDWWVRFAAKECLEGLGSDVWPILARALDDPDRFVRNGAAEVFQNLGLLDSFILMEAASDDPAAAKIDLLRRIIRAGGVRLTDSLIERAGAVMGERVRQLLTTIGLEQVGAA